jgi:hypothetical protein
VPRRRRAAGAAHRGDAGGRTVGAGLGARAGRAGSGVLARHAAAGHQGQRGASRQQQACGAEPHDHGTQPGARALHRGRLRMITSQRAAVSVADLRITAWMCP